MCKIGDFVTSYSAGYWQVIDIKPHYAFDDYSSDTASWKKGDLLGQYIILKKAFTPKMKPRIDFEYVDSAWVKPVSEDILAQINQSFNENPNFKKKFESAEVKLPYSVGSCWLNLPEGEEEKLRARLETLPATFTEEEFWQYCSDYRQYISFHATPYILSFLAYPWNLTENFDLIHFKCDLTKV